MAPLLRTAPRHCYPRRKAATAPIIATPMTARVQAIKTALITPCLVSTLGHLSFVEADARTTQPAAKPKCNIHHRDGPIGCSSACSRSSSRSSARRLRDRTSHDPKARPLGNSRVGGEVRAFIVGPGRLRKSWEIQWIADSSCSGLLMTAFAGFVNAVSFRAGRLFISFASGARHLDRRGLRAGRVRGLLSSRHSRRSIRSGRDARHMIKLRRGYLRSAVLLAAKATLLSGTVVLVRKAMTPDITVIPAIAAMGVQNTIPAVGDRNALWRNVRNRNARGSGRGASR